MTVEQMCQFATLAEQRNYLVAADLLFTTQATLSRHIMAMEEELGFQLFNRTTKRVELTPEGARFLYYAREVRKMQEAYRAALNTDKEKHNGVLAIGYTVITTIYNFTNYLIQFMADHPETEFKVFEADTETLLNSVRDGTCDIAVMQENPFERPTGVDLHRLSTDTMVAVLPLNHRLAKAKSLTLPELRNDRFVTSIINQEPASIFIEACRRSGFEPEIAYPGVIGNSMCGLIAKGGCVGLEWKKAGLAHGNDRVAMVPVEPPLYSHSIIVYQKENLSPAGRKMVSYLRKTWGKEIVQP